MEPSRRPMNQDRLDWDPGLSTVANISSAAKKSFSSTQLSDLAWEEMQ